MSSHDDASSAVFTLDPVDADHIEKLAATLCWDTEARVDDPLWVGSVRRAVEGLPTALRRRLREFRRHSGPAGVLRVRGLPIGADVLPPTPAVDGSVQLGATVPAAVLLLVACTLGDPTAFRAEKGGALVQDVVPVPGREQVQGNAGSIALSFHNENAFHEHRPDLVMLLCLRADHDRMAGLRTACIREVLPHLSAEARAVLSEPEFQIQPPPSFDGGAATAPAPVLSGDAGDPDLRVDLSASSPRTPRAARALSELGELFVEHSRTARLTPGDLAIVDNRVAAHGRTAFRPRYDGLDRWLQRTFVAADLRRSRDHRPDDGYVLQR